MKSSPVSGFLEPIYEFIKLLQEKLNGEHSIELNWITSEQNELKSKIYETAASVEEIKNTPKGVVAFRATCAKNFPQGWSTSKNESPGTNVLDHLVKYI